MDCISVNIRPDGLYKCQHKACWAVFVNKRPVNIKSGGLYKLFLPNLRIYLLSTKISRSGDAFGVILVPGVQLVMIWVLFINLNRFSRTSLFYENTVSGGLVRFKETLSFNYTENLGPMSELFTVKNSD